MVEHSHYLHIVSNINYYANKFYRDLQRRYKSDASIRLECGDGVHGMNPQRCCHDERARPNPHVGHRHPFAPVPGGNNAASRQSQELSCSLPARRTDPRTTASSTVAGFGSTLRGAFLTFNRIKTCIVTYCCSNNKRGVAQLFCQ